MSGTISSFKPGDLVISVSGDGDGSGTYTDNQAAPITLEEINPLTGAIDGRIVLPQTTTTNAAGVTESAISGEYGSSSEGSLTLSADGQSLVIGGYGVNAQTFNAGGAAVYGNASLAQSTSIQGGPYTAVARVVADIGFDGTVDTSTAVYGVYNTNNIRSVATVDGSSFYISGQGVKGDTTQGVFTVSDGAGSATAIDTSTDTRTLEISNGTLYVSRDSKQGSGGTDNIASYGGLPNSATAPTTLAGISKSITLTAAEANGVNNSAIGRSVALSPENFFFASPTVLYVADSGNPKEGGLGDGGLQKWVLANGSWSLVYTMSNGLNLVPDTNTSGTTGLIGLTGKVNADGTVSLYATNSTVGDLDPTYLYGITDTLAATTAPAGQSFTTLVTAAPDSNIRGIAFAPEAACFCPGTLIATPDGAVGIETLNPGDLVETTDGSGAARVIWTGMRAIDLRRHPEAELVQPIRFAPGALAEGVPSRALLVSPDHALHIEGHLIAARLLVNHLSITSVPAAEITYHHIELDRPALLRAEGAACESYLDTGNRAQFTTQAGAGRAAVDASFRPMMTDPAVVQPIWARLAERAHALTQAGPVPAAARPQAHAPLSGDDVLLWAQGHTLAQARIQDGTALLHLDRPTSGRVRLVSDRARPAEARPWLDDRRRLGLAVTAIEAIDAAGQPTTLRPPAEAQGWYAPESDAPTASHWQWTDGAAEIELPGGCVALRLRIHALPPAHELAA